MQDIYIARYLHGI